MFEVETASESAHWQVKAVRENLLSHWWDPVPDRKQLKAGRYCFSLQLKRIQSVCHSGQGRRQEHGRHLVTLHRQTGSEAGLANRKARLVTVTTSSNEAGCAEGTSTTFPNSWGPP